MTQPAALLARFPALNKPAQWPKTVQLGVAAAIIALFAVALLWTRQSDYKVLFSNLADRDGGAIVTALSQMNIPYEFAENGNAILIPAEQVYETRLRLAEQGLPRGGDNGFELLDKTRFGASQFTEQVNYQRALEGELAHSVQELNAVQSARVHLAIPRETLFVRERKAPTASVLVTLYPGRALSENQIAAITWLVSSSVSQLTAENVSVVDQSGRLLTNGNEGQHGGNSTQRSFVIDIEQRATERILNLLTPLMGTGNVRAQVSADVDFSQREQTSEVYGPNQAPDRAAVRSKQTSSSNQAGDNNAQGIPGALSNQAPIDPIAPITAQIDPENTDTDQNEQTQDQNAANVAANATIQQANNPVVLSGTAAPANGTGEMRSEATINYEVDRTISHVKDPVGRLRRLSAAVVVNYRLTDSEPEPLSPEELDQLDALVKQAMGFDTTRGDTLSIINSPFTEIPAQTVAIWKDPTYIEYVMQLGRYLLLLILAWFVWRKILKPIVTSQAQNLSIPAGPSPELQDQIDRAADAKRRASEMNRFEDNLSTARQMAEQDPRAVAMVVRSWMEKDGQRG